MIPASTAKLAYTVEEAVSILPWGKTKVYALIRSGELTSRYQHCRRYVMHEDLVMLLLQVDPSVEAAAANAA